MVAGGGGIEKIAAEQPRAIGVEKPQTYPGRLQGEAKDLGDFAEGRCCVSALIGKDSCDPKEPGVDVFQPFC